MLTRPPGRPTEPRLVPADVGAVPPLPSVSKRMAGLPGGRLSTRPKEATMNKRRRYKAKKKRLIRRRFAEKVNALADSGDRNEVNRFARYLRTDMSPDERRRYEIGEP